MAYIRHSMGVKLHDLRHHTILLVVTPIDFRDEEYFETKLYFEKKHAHVLTASTDHTAKSQFGKTINVDLLLKEVNVDHIAACVFVGGVGVYRLFNDPEAHRIAKMFHEHGVIVGAICSAPVILANAGILDETKATCNPKREELLTEKGAHYTGSLLEFDHKIITANGPHVAHGFAEAVTYHILEHE
jgi:protease I